MVVLDVVVTDKHGNPVRNLSKNDFTVFEDNQQQTIAGFEPADQHAHVQLDRLITPEPGQMDNSQTTAIASTALTILVLDELNTWVTNSGYARVEITKFLRSHGPRLAEPTMLLAMDDKRLELLHDYTRDPNALQTALNRHPAHLPYQLLRGGPLGESARLSVAVEALRQIAAANSHFAGRKNVIWIGSGYPGLNAMLADPNAKARAIAYIRETSELLWQGRVAVYTIDPAGLQVVSENIDSLLSPASGDLIFEQIAPQTGGRMFPHLNDVDSMITTSVEEGESYYALSYYPFNHEWDGKFRRIRIAVHDPKLTARTRIGYFADPESQPGRFELDRLLSRAVLNPLPYHSLEIRAGARLSGSQKRVAHLRVNMDASNLDWHSQQDGKRLCEITLVATAFSAKGDVVSNGVKQFQVLVDQNKYDRLIHHGMVMKLAMPVPLMTVRMRVVVRDWNNGNLGTADLTPEGEQFH